MDAPRLSCILEENRLATAPTLCHKVGKTGYDHAG